MTKYIKHNPIEQAESILNHQKNLVGNLMFVEKPEEKEIVKTETQIIEEWESTSTLQELNSQICECQKCRLGATRNKFVFGSGNPKAEVMFIGEAPGADEDEQGLPFIGRAGQLLTKIIESINFTREEVFICNILKCRPPKNRDPLPDEMQTCEPYLQKQIDIIKPKLIMCLGRISAQSLLRSNETLTTLREKTHIYNGINLMVTYHPAALLRNPHWKRPTWEDLKKFRALYDKMKSESR
ncbi:MAG: uracil-DNA glycosylase [Bacteroidetes bacterium]|nr:uracil-DNA glycosylase [Bacteroidota bacterium]